MSEGEELLLPLPLRSSWPSAGWRGVEAADCGAVAAPLAPPPGLALRRKSAEKDLPGGNERSAVGKG